MTIRDLVNLGIKKLSKSSTSAALDSEVLLSHLLDRPKEYLFANPDKQISPRIEKQFKILLARRLAGEPVAYIKKVKEFLGHKFYVDKNVLVPRPETEGLVELVVSQISNLPASTRSPRIRESEAGRRGEAGKSPISILDIGTGSGNIIISLAKLLPAARCLFAASDVSASALAVAKKNAKLHKAKITFKQGSLLKPWNKQHFDVIIANLPYLEKETDPSTKFEPKVALVAKNKGLALYEELFKQIRDLLPVPYCLFLEIGHDQDLAIKKLAAKLLPAFETIIYKDLFGKNRFVVLQLI